MSAQSWDLKFRFNKAKCRYGVDPDFKHAKYQVCYQRFLKQTPLDHRKLNQVNQATLTDNKPDNYPGSFLVKPSKLLFENFHFPS